MSLENYSTTEYYETQVKKDTSAVYNEVHSEEQLRDYSCGPAVLADVLKTTGRALDQEIIIDRAQDLMHEISSELSMEDIGTPPEIMIQILEENGVEVLVKDSLEYTTQEDTKKSEEFLDNILEEGYVMICPIQTIPNHGEERDPENDGHYVIVCGKTMINGHKYYITADPMFHYYQRLSNEQSLYGVHMGEDVREETPKTVPEVSYKTAELSGVEHPRFNIKSNVDTRNVKPSKFLFENFGIDPDYYGVRFINARLFMENWHDTSGLGKEYNQYGIAVKVKNQE